MKHLLPLFFLAVIVSGCGFKPPASNPDAYMDKFSRVAVSEMNRTGVPASITLAQGILESGWGTSKLSVKGNNHFGIKADSRWTGPTISRKGAKYRKYKKAEESYKDHNDFLVDGQRYDFLFQLSPKDYKGWAKGLQKAGYSTSSTYSRKLIDLIERYQLSRFD